MRNIALCMELTDFYEHGIARGVVRYAKAKPDWRLYGYGWMFRSLDDIGQWEGDGIIARVEDSASADRLSAIGLPVIDVAGAYSRPGFRSVTNDDSLTGSRAAAHLIGCGFTNFAFLGVSGTRWSDQRKEGFAKALERSCPRIPAFERSLAWWEGRERGRNPEPDESELAAFLLGLRKPSALFACNDTTGLRATELARRLDIAVPESLAILGVDDEDILCELASPSLSSIMLDCEAIGYRAAVVLDSVLDGMSEGTEGPPEFARITVPPREVAERESTRVFTCEDELVARAATFIRAHAQEGIDVSDVLGVVSASRRSLETRFHKALGRTLHEEIVWARIARAKRLLGGTSYTLGRVAEESGFGALGRFHEAFKEAEGLSPGEWRRKNREGRQ
jgi:LacI family transcriptional regulator